MTNLDRSLSVFLTVLRSSWNEVERLAVQSHGLASKEFVDDWLEATWEMVVEAAVSDGRIYLEPYGEGADCNSIGSRVWSPGVGSTHSVNFVAKPGVVLVDVLGEGRILSLPPSGVPLECFAARQANGWYEPHPPFDHALGYLDGTDVLVSLVDLDFRLVESLRP